MNSARSEGDATNEALLLRAVRQKNASVAFYKKTQNMREMHKNRQNSVEINRHILFEEGMDAREMKKQILFDALDQYDTRQKEGEGLGIGPRTIVARLTDRNPEDVTLAMIKRFRKVLTQMVEDAESKI
jgi:hypothetical protein